MKSKIFLTTLITDMNWTRRRRPLLLLGCGCFRGNKPSLRTDTKVVLPRGWISNNTVLAIYLTDTSTVNCADANNYIIRYIPDRSSFLAIQK